MSMEENDDSTTPAGDACYQKTEQNSLVPGACSISSSHDFLLCQGSSVDFLPLAPSSAIQFSNRLQSVLWLEALHRESG